MSAQATFDGINEAAVAAIAALFGVEPAVEPYTPDGTAVYRLRLAGPADGISLVLWPSLGRVDVNRAGEHGWVMKHVGKVELYAGVECVFRPAVSEGSLTVTVNGFVNMVMG